MFIPWNSIAESITSPPQDNVLTPLQAKESPCQNCVAPCCSHLPLNTFRVTNLVELDHALYLLNFDHIELGISASGDWSAYYTYPCRFLDRQTFRCTVHNTPDQPQICVHYNPYNCWYKRVFSVGQNEHFVRLDYARMQFLLDYIEFNEQREIVSVPAWEDLIALMAQFGDEKRPPQPDPPVEDAAFQQWQQLVLHPEEETPPEVIPLTFHNLQNPCAGCAAYCCRTLVFPQAVPQHLSNLDYYRFCLGFPGIEVGISDSGWSIIVKTTCRHLDEHNLCRLYGQPERPLLCKYYDAWKCDYLPQFSRPRPDQFMRVRLEQFLWLLESLTFDPQGSILAVPPVAEMRWQLETAWRQASAEVVTGDTIIEPATT